MCLCFPLPRSCEERSEAAPEHNGLTDCRAVRAKRPEAHRRIRRRGEGQMRRVGAKATDDGHTATRASSRSIIANGERPVTQPGRGPVCSSYHPKSRFLFLYHNIHTYSDTKMKFLGLFSAALLSAGASARGLNFLGSDSQHTLEEGFPVPGDNPLLFCAAPTDNILEIEKVDLSPNPPSA
jgi:hypothetical protein